MLVPKGQILASEEGIPRPLVPDKAAPAGSTCKHSSPAGRAAAQMAPEVLCRRNVPLLFPMGQMLHEGHLEPTGIHTASVSCNADAHLSGSQFLLLGKEAGSG